MKKAVVLVLLVAMTLVTALSGCAQASNEPGISESAASEPTASEAVEQVSEAVAEVSESAGIKPEDIKIGVDFFNWTMPLALDIKAMLDSAQATLGCQIEYTENNFETEKLITNVENLFASGCQVVIICNSGDAQVQQAVKIAEQYNGKIFQFFRTLSDKDVIDYVSNSPAYGGQVHEDEMSVGYNLGLILAEKGAKNVGLMNYTRGDLTAETRQAGYEKAFEEKGVNVVAETWDVTTSDLGTSTTENYLAAYPEMDAVVLVGGGSEAVYGITSALESNGKAGKILFTTTDFYDGQDEDLKNGTLSGISGGHWCDPFFTFMLAYNTAAGAFTDDQLPIEIPLDMIYLSSYDDAELFAKWFEDSLPYNPDEIKAMSYLDNPDFSLDQFIATAKALSLQDVETRHSGN
jgi:ribose transport system substrate-binding protein